MSDDRIGPRRPPDEDFEEHTTATIAEAFDVMVEASGIVHHNATFLSKVVRSFYVRALKPMAYIVTCIIVILALQQLSLINRDKKVDQVADAVKKLDADTVKMQHAAEDAKIAAENARQASIEAKIASDAAKKSLDEALAQSQRGGVSPQIVDALNRINDIYATCVQQKEC